MSVVYLNTNKVLNSAEDFDEITGWECGCIDCLNNIYELPSIYRLQDYYYDNELQDYDYGKFIKKHNRNLRYNRAAKIG